MADYIKRENLIESIKNDCCELVYYSKKDAIDCINAEPAADVAPVVHGKWMYEERENSLLFWIHCSVCGWKSLDQSVSLAYHYCPNCGAKMDGGEKANE